MHLLAILLTLFWIVAAALRSWRLARFYQIEEYMADRYVRWLLARRERWFPRQPAIVMLAGVVVAFALQFGGVEYASLHGVLWAVVAMIIAQPEPVKEVKRQFRRTQRALRIVGAACLLDALVIAGLSAQLTANMAANTPQELSTVSIAGFIGFLFAPLALPLGNLLLTPLEAQLRERFRRQARARLQAAAPFVIGITGSYGKTSTKHYLAHILGGKHKVYPTPKSYNTEMGVCLAINTDLDPSYGYAYFIAEMGAYVPGEIARIAKLTQPRMSIVTAVGPMHLERFKTIENIVKAKYEIVEGVPPDGTTFFNGDNPYVRQMAPGATRNTASWSRKKGCPKRVTWPKTCSNRWQACALRSTTARAKRGCPSRPPWWACIT
ncbi:MAG: hypothetical protein HC915_06835 [Anaerolineae bacterium]|nr:hypothetical protein [Anaerolineae bacterium]